MEKEKVLFYEGYWYPFSNFSSFAVYWRDRLWMTSEHAYQAAKFFDEEIINEIQQARSAYDTKKIAHEYKENIRSDWLEVNLGIMEEIVRSKLEQHPYIQKKLIETGNREIIENSPKDSFWGRGPDWNGLNHLGKIWMKLRAELFAFIFECKCTCHTDFTLHIMACCDGPCKICGLHIKTGKMKEHVGTCH